MAKRKQSWSERLFSNRSKLKWRPELWGGKIQDVEHEINKTIPMVRRLRDSLRNGDAWTLDDYDSLVTHVSNLYNVMELDKLAQDKEMRKRQVRELVDKNEASKSSKGVSR